MSVSWVDGSTAVFVTSATSISGNAPAGVANGDTMLAAVFARSAITTPSGWTKLAETPAFVNGGSDAFLAVFSKNSVTSADASASFSFAQASADRMGLVYAVARDVSSIGTATAISSNVDSWQITPAALTAASNGALMVCFGAQILFSGSGSGFPQVLTPGVPSSFTLFSGAGLEVYRLAGARRAINSGQSNGGAFDFTPPVGDPPSGLELGNNGLGAVTVLLEPAGAAPTDGLVSAAGPLGVVLALGTHSRGARAAAPSMLGTGLVLAFHEFTGHIEGQPLRYVMDLTTPSGVVRVPISSWQATQQVEQSNYVQCVVPACGPYVEQINVATSFRVLRTARLPDGSAFEYEMASSPADQVSIARGTANYTATLSGYTPGAAADAAPPEITSRILREVRTITTQVSGIRVRCAVDWLLRPGQIAYVDGTPFIVAYINYYVSDGDQYMDVGERVGTV